MNQTQAYDAVMIVLHEVAPEIDLATVDTGVELHAGLDLDSMDFLNLIAGIHEHTGRDIPERDYGRLLTLADFVAYLSELAPSV